MSDCCDRCGSIKNLTKCSLCKTSQYCSKICKKLSLKSHLHLCYILQNIRKKHGVITSVEFKSILDKFVKNMPETFIIKELARIDQSIKIKMRYGDSYTAKLIQTNDIANKINIDDIDENECIKDISGNLLNIRDIKSFSNKYERFLIICLPFSLKNCDEYSNIIGITRRGNWLPDISE